jgi:hypothetical protein
MYQALTWRLARDSSVMNEHQETALKYHCRLASETAHPRFGYLAPGRIASIVLSVNSGYE